MQFHQLLGDGESQPQPAVSAVEAALGLAERLEYERKEIGRDPRPGVGDDDFDVCAVATKRSDDPAVLARKLDGVRQKIPEDLLQPRGVCPEEAGERVEVGL